MDPGGRRPRIPRMTAPPAEGVGGQGWMPGAEEEGDVLRAPAGLLAGVAFSLPVWLLLAALLPLLP